MAVTKAIKLALDFRNPKQFPDTLWNHFRISVPFSITKASEMYWRLRQPCLEVFSSRRTWRMTEAQRKQCNSTDPTYAVPFHRGLQSPRMSIQHLSWTRKTTKREKRYYFLAYLLLFPCPSVRVNINFGLRTDKGSGLFLELLVFQHQTPRGATGNQFCSNSKKQMQKFIG